MAKDQDYNRPNQDWVCGRAADGKACALGPSGKGICNTTHECKPEREGDRWICTRIPSRGGKCKTGPLPDGTCCEALPPCQPVRSLRAKRKLMSLVVLGLSMGIILVALGVKPSTNHLLSPGQLSSQHRSILHNCNSCHGVKNEIPLQWFARGKDAHGMSQNCISCHTMSDQAFHVHGIAPDKLALSTKRIAELTGKRMPNSVHDDRQMECASCHKEHLGSDEKLVHLTNQQCQSCHIQSFHSLAKGHPEFAQYPFKRRVRILFDHKSHFDKYFGEKKHPEISCNQCHIPDSQGQRMLVKGFEKSCVECHESAIRGVEQTQKGIAFWRLPTVDLKALANSKIGSWPEDADGKLTPFQRVLLAGDERFANAYEKVADKDLADLTSLNPEEMNAAVTVIWGVKALLSDLAKGGSPFLKAHIEKAVGHPITDSDAAALIGSLPIEVIRRTNATWFKDLDRELAAWKSGHPPATSKFKSRKTGDEGDESWSEAGGWYRNSGDFTIKLRARGHADPFVHAWIDLLVSSKEKGVGITKAMDAILDPKSPGTCLKCHSVDQNADGSISVNWQAKNSSNAPPAFEKFNHSAHFPLIKDTGCITCHAVNDKADFDKNLEGKDPSKFESNFMPIKKESCVTCHGSSDRVSDSCQTCHKYHPDGQKRMFVDFDKIKTKM